MHTSSVKPIGLFKFIPLVLLLLIGSFGPMYAQGPYTLNFDNQPGFTNSWQENGYQWDVIVGNQSYISPGASISGNNKLEIAQPEMVLAACGSFNPGAVFLRAQNFANGIQSFVVKGEDANGVMTDSVNITALFNANPNIYLPVSLNWSNIRRLHVDVLENAGPNTPQGVVYMDSLNYNLTGIICPQPFAQINQPVKQGYQGQYAQIQLASFGGTCLSFQWQVDTGNGFTNISVFDNNYLSPDFSLLGILIADTAMNGYQYRCVVNSFCGIVISDTTTLQVDVCTFSPVITSNSLTNTFCIDEIVQLTVTAGDSYSWSTDDVSQVISFPANSNQTYFAATVDSAGCLATSNISITVNANPTINLSVVEPSCYGGQATVTVSNNDDASPYLGEGDYSVSFSGPDTTVTFSITNGDGCQDSSAIIIYQPDQITVGSISVVNAVCFGNYDGSITIQGVTGGVSDEQLPTGYSYELNSQSMGTLNDITGFFGGLVNDSYGLTITDFNGCMQTLDSNILVGSPPAISMVLSPIYQQVCSGNLGTLMIDVNGGTGPVSYNLFSGSAFNAFTGQQGFTDSTNLSPGDYYGVATDSLGCTGYSNVALIENGLLPDPVITSNGSLNFCSGTSLTLKVDHDGGNALFFDGQDDYVVVQNSNLPLNGDSRTVEGWIKPAVVNQSARSIFSWGTENSGSKFQLIYDNGYLKFSNGDFDLSGTTFIDSATWTHVAVTYSQSVVKVFVNGLADINTETFVNTDSTDLTFGTGPAGNNGLSFHGDMDEFRVWDYALTQAEVYSNRTHVMDTGTTGLVSYYRMNEGTGLTTADAAQNVAAPAVLVNGVLWSTPGAPIESFATYSWSPNGELTDSVNVTAAGTYSVFVTDVNGCSAGASISVTSSSCITPYYPPPGGGKINDLIGPELTQLYLNQNSLDPDSVADIYNILNDSVLFEVVGNS